MGFDVLRFNAPSTRAFRAYTPDVASWPRRLTSLATVIALSGCPAMLSTCMALCLPTAPMTAMAHKQDTPVGQAAPASTAAGVSGHSHHGAPAAHAAPASADARASAHALSDARLGATGHACCPDGVAVVAVAGPRVARTDAHVWCEAMGVPVSRYLLTTSVRDVTSHGPPASPSAPPWAPRVLRI